MNYEKLVQGILNIGEAMLQCGAEIFRVEDSLYRMYKSYGFVKYDVYVIPSNIQVTVESPEGRFSHRQAYRVYRGGLRQAELSECPVTVCLCI